MNFNDMQALSFEIKNLHDRIEIYSKNNEYVYADVYKSWVNDYYQAWEPPLLSLRAIGIYCIIKLESHHYI